MIPELVSQDLPGWLADVALQATLILAAAGGFVMLRPRMAAARRHTLCIAALLTIPVLILCSGLAPVWRPFGELPSSARVTWPAEVAVRKTFYPDGSQKETAASATPAPQIIDGRSVSPWVLLSCLWLAGIGAGALALVRAALRLRRLSRTTVAESDPRLLQIFQETQRRLKVALPDSALRRSAACVVPMTWGWRQGTVLLPAEASEWSDARLRLVLRHELAHIARGDVLMSFLTTVSALLLWFHPLVWLLWRAGNQAREQACDDIALQHEEASREDFAAELLSAVSELRGFHRCTLPLALAMAASSQARAMRNRLASILDEARARSPWPRSQGVLLMLSAIVAAFALSGLTACRTSNPGRAQIQISSKVFEITTKNDSTLLSDAGLPATDGTGIQMMGIHDDKVVAELIRKLSSKKGVDLLSAPSVTTRDKQTAKVEIVREFLYPTEFDPPKLPDFKDGKPIQLAPGQSIAVTPTTPTAFEMKPVGVRMEFTPEIVGDGTIDLQISPEITEFEGFKDYGSPIKATTMGADGKLQETTLTENKIQQPIFHTRKLATSVTLRDGTSVIFGGLMRTDVQQVQDNGKSREDRLERRVFFIVQAKIVRP